MAKGSQNIGSQGVDSQLAGKVGKTTGTSYTNPNPTSPSMPGSDYKPDSSATTWSPNAPATGSNPSAPKSGGEAGYRPDTSATTYRP